MHVAFSAPYMDQNIKDEVFYPNLDTGASGGTQPVTVGAEAESIDGVTTVQGVEVFALIQVPQHGLSILDEKKKTHL